MKKVLSVFLITAILLTLFAVAPLSAGAKDQAALAETGAVYTYGNYTYEVLSGGTARITKYSGKETNINIPSTLGGYKVTEIGGSAFNSSDTPENVVIPDTVKTIGSDAFRCKWLESVTFGSSVESIGSCAFSGASHLKTLNFKNSPLRFIGSMAFSDCKALTDVKLPDSVTEFDGMVFYNCEGLKTISVGNSLTKLGHSTFSGCKSLTSITLPDTLTTIDAFAFDTCEKLKSIKLPKNLLRIEGDAFIRCSSLSEISLPNGLLTLNDSVFYGCVNLKKVIVPDTVTEIGGCCFFNCEGLTEVHLSNSVQMIKSCTFAGCKSLRKVNIPDSVTEIEGEAFDNCYSLRSIVCKSVRIIGRIAFYHCENLKTAVLGNSLKNLGSAFTGCYSLTTVYLPETLRELNSDAFWGCDKLKNIYFSGSKSTWDNDVNKYSLSLPSTTKITYNYDYSNIYDYLLTPEIFKLENTASGVKIAWDSVDDAAKYCAFFKDGSKWTKLVETTGTSFVHKNVKSGTKYTYTVRCLSADGKTWESDYDRDGWSITYIAQPKLTKFENTASGVKITIGKVTGAAKYRVFFKNGAKWSKVGDTASTSFVHKAVKSGTKYTYTVRCLSKDGKSYTSTYNTKGWTATFIAQPALPTLKNTKNGVQITLKKVAGAAKYRIFRKTGSGKWAKLVDTTALKYVDKKAKKGVTYKYSVRCITKNGKSYTSSYNTTGKSIKCKR